MTREEARKIGQVMLAYADGKNIQCLKVGHSEWQCDNEPSFD